MTALVASAFDLLGPSTLLVPCARGTKVPLQPYKHRKSELFFSDAWMAIFEVHNANIAVILGERSGHLIAIDFDSDDDGLVFDAWNPHLVDTLRTRGSRGWQIWLRLPSGEYPGSQKTPTCEWRADGNLSTFSGIHPSGCQYQILSNNPPQEIKFTDVRWPDGWQVPNRSRTPEAIFDELRAAYGQPYFSNPKGEPQKLNEPFWAGLYATEHTLLWEPRDERFYAYAPSNGLWCPENVPAIQQRLTNRLLAASRAMNVPWLERQRDSAKLSGVISHVKAVTVRINAFAKEMKYLHTANGVLVWRGDAFTFEEFSPDFYSRNASPVAYVPGADCPRFKTELLSALNADDQRLLQMQFGQALLGINLTQTILILGGMAGTGKSQLMIVLRGLVGEENCCNLRTDLLGERFELSNYVGKSLLVGADVGSDFLSNKGAQQLKALTGGEALMAEFKGGNDNPSIRGEYNIAVTTNCRLRVRLQEDQGAWRRRLLILNFDGQPPAVAIPDFGRLLLQTEGSGILNWCIEGLHMLFSELGVNRGRLALTKAQRDRVDRLILESESLKAFLAENVRWDMESDLTVSEILEAYVGWCESKELDPTPEYICQKQLPQLMLELFKVSKSSSVKRVGKNCRGFSKSAFLIPQDEHY